jgi:hypothetical protein
MTIQDRHLQRQGSSSCDDASAQRCRLQQERSQGSLPQQKERSRSGQSLLSSPPELTNTRMKPNGIDPGFSYTGIG